VHEYRADF
jgi:hypothetical protein